MSSGQLQTSSCRSLDLAQPAVMGILNMTPDSFSDGGSHHSVAEAVAHCHTMIDEGAEVIDIGGESTRPGSETVTLDEELARVIPVVEALRAESDVFISVDTSNAEVIRQASVAGADMINDIRALSRPGALETVAEAGVAICIMHMQGTPATMQNNPHYEDVVGEIKAYLAERVDICRRAGVPAERICVDPGFGFGKTLAHNLALMRALPELAVAGCPVLMGVSRKSMFKQLFSTDDMATRINASLGAAFWASLQGIGIIRCHDVARTVQMVQLASSLQPPAMAGARLM